MKTNPKEIGQRIKQALAAAGLNQRALARRLNITDASVSAYVLGDARMTEESYVVLSEMCGVSIDWLITGKLDRLAEVNEPETEYKKTTPEEEDLLRILQECPDIRKAVKAMIQLPERKQIIHLGKMLEDLEKIEEGKG